VQPVSKHRLGAGVIVVRCDAVLLTHHVKPGVYDYWSPPGGGVHPGEDIKSAARREAFEETGLAIEPEALLYVEQLIGPFTGTHHTKMWFAGRITDSAVPVSIAHPEAVHEQIVEARFVARAEFTGKLIFPAILADKFWNDLALGTCETKVLPMREMLFE
jgi:8-oxo-dGTP diphosphatase